MSSGLGVLNLPCTIHLPSKIQIIIEPSGDGCRTFDRLTFSHIDLPLRYWLNAVHKLSQYYTVCSNLRDKDKQQELVYRDLPLCQFCHVSLPRAFWVARGEAFSGEAFLLPSASWFDHLILPAHHVSIGLWVIDCWIRLVFAQLLSRGLTFANMLRVGAHHQVAWHAS